MYEPIFSVHKSNPSLMPDLFMVFSLVLIITVSQMLHKLCYIYFCSISVKYYPRFTDGGLMHLLLHLILGTQSEALKTKVSQHVALHYNMAGDL